MSHPLHPVALVREAWSIVATRRSLWWLGVLAGLGQGFGMNTQVVSRLEDQLDPEKLQSSLEKLPTQFSLLLFLVLVFLLVVWVFSVMAEAGLMKSVRVAKEGKETSFRKGLSAGKPALWPLIKLTILLGGASVVVAFVVGLPALSLVASSSTTGLLTGAIGLVVFLIYGLLLALLYPWMTRFVVLRELTPFAAIRAAWQLFRAKTGLFIRLGITGALVQIIGSLLLIIAALILFVPLFVVALLLFQEEAVGVATGSVAVGVVVVAIFLAGLLTALKNAYYTLAFDRVTSHS